MTRTFEADLSVDAARFDLRQAVSALERCGCFIVRRALPRGVLQDMLDAVQRGYEEMEDAYRSGALGDDVVRRNYGYGILRPFENDLRTARGALLRDLMLGFVGASPLRDIVAGYLGASATLLLEACHVRRQGPGQPGRPVPLHQDCSVMRMKRGRLLNFWVPLVDGAGRSSPGLEFFPRSLDRILDTPQRPAPASARERMYTNFEIPESDVRAALADVPSWRPVLDCGDVLCLDGWTVHRTHFDAGMVEMRYGFETRLCRTSDLQPGMPGHFQAL